jgi:exodeoxyribonuclease III
MALRLATWNVNSIRIRLDNLARFVERWQPDVICMQEIKVADELFPTDALLPGDYPHRLWRGMKSYNGVAILSRHPLGAVAGPDWCRKGDCRHVAATLPGGIELHNFYVPAGGDIPDPKANPKFAHKLQFLDEMTDWFAAERDGRKKMILVGDLNIAPLEQDVWSHAQLLDVVSHTPVEVERMGKLRDGLGWVDAVRHFVPASEKLYSWWSYRARDWALSDRGRRLDHVWVTRPLKPALAGAAILREARGWPQPSDHVPVIVDLA